MPSDLVDSMAALAISVLCQLSTGSIPLFMLATVPVVTNKILLLNTESLHCVSSGRRSLLGYIPRLSAATISLSFVEVRMTTVPAGFTWAQAAYAISVTKKDAFLM